MAYNHKISIQTFSETEDKIGNHVEKWTDMFSGGVWADINGIGGREYYAAAETNSENDMKFKIRYSKAVAEYKYKTAEIRIIYSRKVYNIKHIDDFHEQHRELVIRATALN